MLFQKIIFSLIFLLSLSTQGISDPQSRSCHKEFENCEISTGKAGICVTGTCYALCDNGMGALVEGNCFAVKFRLDSQSIGAHCVNIECKTLGKEYNFNYNNCFRAVTACCKKSINVPICTQLLKDTALLNTYCRDICSAS